MPKSKTRKNHSQKVKKRNERLQNEQKQLNKLRRDWINNLIKKEQEQGAFENTTSLTNNDDIELEGPII
jgi:hypothetical protein